MSTAVTTSDSRRTPVAAHAARRHGCASRCCISSCSARVLFGVDHCHRRPSRRSAHHRHRRRSRRARPGKSFKDARGREPNEEELYALRRVWLDNEVLYREGLALRLDKGDNAIRERVIFKALSMVDAGIKRPPIDDKVLREWFEKNRARYDEPARYDFQEAVLAGESLGSRGARIRERAERRHAAGDVEAGLARVHGPAARQPRAELRRGLRRGARSLAAPGEWRALQQHGGLARDAPRSR